jgi:hypothetical protein
MLDTLECFLLSLWLIYKSRFWLFSLLIKATWASIMMAFNFEQIIVDMRLEFVLKSGASSVNSSYPSFQLLSIADWVSVKGIKHVCDDPFESVTQIYLRIGVKEKSRSVFWCLLRKISNWNQNLSNTNIFSFSPRENSLWITFTCNFHSPMNFF